MGVPPSTTRTVRGHYQHGDTLLGTTLEPRLLQVVYTVRNAPVHDVVDLRRAFTTLKARLAQFLTPADGVTFNFLAETDQAFFYYLRGVRLESLVHADAPDPRHMALTLRLQCPDPLWRRRTARAHAVTVSAGAPISEDLSVAVLGSWYAYPTLTIAGAFTNPRLANAATGEALGLDYTLAGGETVTVTMDPAGTSVASDVAGDITHTLAEDADLQLLLSPFTSGGANALTLTADALVGDGTVTLGWEDTFIAL